MATFKILGDVVNDPSANNIGGAKFVRIVATGGTVTGTVNLADNTRLANSIYMQLVMKLLSLKTQQIKLHQLLVMHMQFQ